MPPLNVHQSHPRKPTSVALSELPIAAGVAGHSVTLCFHDFPAPILCQLYKHCTRYAGANKVLHVYTQADVNKLGGRVSQVRLAVVYAPRLRNAATWAIQMAATADGDSISRPSLFCVGGNGDPEEDPGNTLLLHGDAHEHTAVAQWLAVTEPDLPAWESLPAGMNIRLDPALEAIFSPCHCHKLGLNRLRDRQVAHALLVGACLQHSLRQDGPAPATLTASVDDYALVRRLLQTPVAAAADEPHDPLAADMASRANVFMAVKYAPELGASNPFGSSNYGTDRSGRPGRELITRREISDLGNIRSRMVRRLIEFLQRQPDGYERFRRMGLVRPPPEHNAWRSAGVDSLITCLRTWSAKQVRTHFEQLRRAGMITAEREHDNGPWQYELPEELTSRSSVFRGLPSVENIGHGTQAS